MSKTLSTEMSVDQLRRHIAERSRQLPVERLEIEEAETMLQVKLLEQTNVRLELLNAHLEQFRADLGRLVQGLQDGLGAQEGLQRSMRRYARTNSFLTLLLIVASALLARVGWTQLAIDDRTAPTRPPAKAALPVPAVPAVQAVVAKPTAQKSATDRFSPARTGIVSPYHLPPGMELPPAGAQKKEPTASAQPMTPAVALQAGPVVSPILIPDVRTIPQPAAATATPSATTVVPAASVISEQRADVTAAATTPSNAMSPPNDRPAVPTLGSQVYGPRLPSGLMSPFPPMMNDPRLQTLPASHSCPVSTAPSATPTSTHASPTASPDAGSTDPSGRFEI